jgi:hypothetical protein
MSDSTIRVWIAGIQEGWALKMVGPATANLPLPITRPGQYKLVVTYRGHQQSLTVLITSEALSLVGDGPLVEVVPRRTARLQPHSVYVRCGPARQPMATCDSIAQELQDTFGLRPIVLPANLTAPWIHPFGAEHPWPKSREDYFSYSDTAQLTPLPKYLAARSKSYWNAHSSAFTLDYWTWRGDGATCFDGTCHPYR